jgi:cytochrome P450
MPKAGLLGIDCESSSAMLHDETVFADPEDFRPERFIKDGKINSDIPDPDDFATFGFGRRCVTLCLNARS